MSWSFVISSTMVYIVFIVRLFIFLSSHDFIMNFIFDVVLRLFQLVERSLSLSDVCVLVLTIVSTNWLASYMFVFRTMHFLPNLMTSKLPVKPQTFLCMSLHHLFVLIERIFRSAAFVCSGCFAGRTKQVRQVVNGHVICSTKKHAWFRLKILYFVCKYLLLLNCRQMSIFQSCMISIHKV